MAARLGESRAARGKYNRRVMVNAARYFDLGREMKAPYNHRRGW